MSLALNKIVEKLTSKEINFLNEKEVLAYSLALLYAEKTNNKNIQKFIDKLLELKLSEYGRARRDLLSLIRSVNISELTQSRGSYNKQSNEIVLQEQLENIMGRLIKK